MSNIYNKSQVPVSINYYKYENQKYKVNLNYYQQSGTIEIPEEYSNLINANKIPLEDQIKVYCENLIALSNVNPWLFKRSKSKKNSIC